MIKLTIELVPKTTWYINARAELTKSQWDKLRKKIYARANNKCEICGGRGRKHPVECHEIWGFNNNTNIQILKGLQALCPKCHMVKHIGLSIERGKCNVCVAHLAAVNGWTECEAEIYITKQFEEWTTRSRSPWEVDMSMLELLITEGNSDAESEDM